MSSKMYKKKMSKMSKNIHTNCSGWCWPTLIYIALSVLGLIVVLTGQSPQQLSFRTNEERNKYLMSQIFTQLIWIVILYALCSKCKSNIAWFILFLPVLIVFFVGVLVLGLLVTRTAPLQ